MSLTVCIAAIGTWLDGNRTREVIILAGDRMITAGNIREYELQEQTKLAWYRNNVAVMMAGSVDQLLEAFNSVVSRLGHDATVAELSKALADEIQNSRRRDIERIHFEPYNLTIDQFIKRQKEWTPDFWERLNTVIDDSEADIGEVIVAGFDPDGAAHLYSIEGAGRERPWRSTGYCAIGIGWRHAEAEFAHARFSPKREWIQTMRITFFAKKRAEEAPGVGYSTDLWYVTPAGASYFPPGGNIVSLLDHMYSLSVNAELSNIVSDANALEAALLEERGAVQPNPGTEEERAKAEEQAFQDQIAPDADAQISTADDADAGQKAEHLASQDEPDMKHSGLS